MPVFEARLRMLEKHTNRVLVDILAFDSENANAVWKYKRDYDEGKVTNLSTLLKHVRELTPHAAYEVVMIVTHGTTIAPRRPA